MVITVSLVVLFGLALFFLLRFRQVSPGSAFTAVMFGFFLASTGAAEPINRVAESLITAATNL
ncbi:hypothetical protein [Streptomyces globisporus]|uniref:hypothetical protein n=1 Tax=Streptomyces globisporus TaxID=1908 RepID=UPI0004C58A16|nr:hypothetical protein [Streptomyces globisporus]